MTSITETVDQPILLLDFDGVLHPDCVFRMAGGGLVLKREGVELFEWAPYLDSLLKDFPAVRIVLSSSWVHALGFEAARDALPEGLGSRVIGSTMDPFMAMARWKRMERGEQIRRYVEHRRLVSWVAIDDGVEHWPSGWDGRLIRCDPDLGLSEPAVLDALRLALGELHESP